MRAARNSKASQRSSTYLPANAVDLRQECSLRRRLFPIKIIKYILLSIRKPVIE